MELLKNPPTTRRMHGRNSGLLLECAGETFVAPLQVLDPGSVPDRQLNNNKSSSQMVYGVPHCGCDPREQLS